MNMLTSAAKGKRLDVRNPTTNSTSSSTIGGAAIESIAVTRRHHIDLDSYMAGANEFFSTHAKQSADIGSPYVAHEGIEPLEFTAAIRVTGSLRGTVYVSASRAMLTIMLMRMGATDINTDNMGKVLRNLASAMVAFARRDSGFDVLVRDPSTVSERREKIGGAGNAVLVAPIHWRKFTAQVVVAMD